MARLFVRLKLALLANGFRRGWQQGVGIIIAALYALPISMLGARGLMLLGRRENLASVAEPLLVIGLCLLWFGWIVGPLLSFGMDETLDPGRLRLLPLRRGQLMRGLAAASAIGIGPLATAILLYGIFIGFASGAGALIVLAAVVVQFLLCIVSARAITTALSRRLASRRGRDLITVGAALFGLVIAGLAQVPRFVIPEGHDQQALARLIERLGDFAQGLTAFPPAWSARSIGAAARGELGVAVLWLVAAAAAAAAFAWWWAVGLERGLDARRSNEAAGREADLFPPPLRWLPRTRFGAGVAKDVRYAWRVPQLRVQYLMLGLMLVPVAFVSLSQGAQPFTVLLTPLALLLVGTAGFNLFGADRGAVWLLYATGPAPRTDLLAKTAVTAGLGIPIAAVLATVLAAVTGAWAYLVPTVLLAVGVQGAVAAVGVVVSVLAPFPFPDSPTNVFAANAGAGCTAAALQGAGLIIELILLAPVAVGVVVSVARETSLLPVALVAVAWGALLWWLGIVIASNRLKGRGPEFVAALRPRSG